ncbi:MAG: alpha/beta hydrolase [Christensenellales bacterium]|jgi:pimeloyl-ACP methyl ester carboxylesterase
MTFTRKRPTFPRFLLCLLLGVLTSGGLLVVVQRFYQQYLEKSALREPFFLLAGISALVTALFLFFPANRPGKLLKWFWRLVALVLVLTLGWGIGSFYIAQNDLLYMPGRHELAAEESLRQVPGVEAVALPGGEGQTLHGYFWKTTDAPAGLVLYFGGNGELAAGRVNTLIKQNTDSLLKSYHFMMVDYPGYGNSEGEPTEQSILAMADAALAYALSRADVSPDRVVIAGYSLGTGPAAYLAAKHKPAGLVLMAPFFNGEELVADFITSNLDAPDIIQWVAALFTRNKYPNHRHAEATQAPTLVIAGLGDTLVPFHQAERLAALYQKGRLVTLEGGHTAPWVDQFSLQSIEAFLKEIDSGSSLDPAQPSSPSSCALSNLY